MKRWLVIYLSADNTKRLEEEFDDFNPAINFYAEHGGPVRATIWEMVRPEKYAKRKTWTEGGRKVKAAKPTESTR